MAVLTAKQEEAQQVLSGSATFEMLFGGSRSGKTFLLVKNVVTRAIKAPGSRHAIFRFRFNHVKNSIIQDTFPKVMAIFFTGIDYVLNKTDWFVTFPNGSEIWFGGLDDKERTDKILGLEFATIYANECSQIPWASIQTAITRLAQKVDQNVNGASKLLKLRFFFDCNPTSKAHWSYRLFIEKRDPETRMNMPNPANYISFKMNPESNAENLSPGYLDLLKSQSARLQKRFLHGEFSDATPNALWTDGDIDKWRIIEGQDVPEFIRIVVAVDPSGADENNPLSDAIGIVVVALGSDGIGYVLEDLTLTAGPATWGKVAASAYDRHAADIIVAEANYGGAMVKHVIQTARPGTPFKMVTASRGKHVRAEPIASLAETGKIRHIGVFQELEDELCAFSTAGYLGDRSPNRADAMIWGMAELFPGMVKDREKKPLSIAQPDHRLARPIGSSGWMQR